MQLHLDQLCPWFIMLNMSDLFNTKHFCPNAKCLDTFQAVFQEKNHLDFQFWFMTLGGQVGRVLHSCWFSWISQHLSVPVILLTFWNSPWGWGWKDQFCFGYDLYCVAEGAAKAWCSKPHSGLNGAIWCHLLPCSIQYLHETAYIEIWIIVPSKSLWHTALFLWNTGS